MKIYHSAKYRSMCVRVIIVIIFMILFQPGQAVSKEGMENASAISSCGALQNMNNALDGDFYLTSDIDCSATNTWNGGLGFSPIGYQLTPFTGSFDGGGFTISGLTINRPGPLEVGLFGNIGSGVVVKDVHLVNINITGTWWVGGLAGVSSGKLSGISASGMITGSTYGVGGLVGKNLKTISGSSSTVTVTSLDKDAGGLVGSNNGVINQSYATGPVNSKGNAGGLAGFNAGIISQCYATSLVGTEDNSAGGLVGRNFSGASLLDSFASGAVSGGSGSTVKVGGLVGENNSGLGGPASVSNCYSRGYVSGGAGSILGGLIGSNDAAPADIVHSYWDRITSGQITSDGGTGKTPFQMKQQTTYEEWDFNIVWSIEEGIDYPQLRMKSMTVVMLPVIMGNYTHLNIWLGLHMDEQGIYLQYGGDVDTLVSVLSTNPERSVHSTGNGEILPSADMNQIPDWYMQFDVDDAILFEEPATTRLLVEVAYVDIGNGTFRIEYDSHSGGPFGDGRFRPTGIHSKSDSGNLVKTYFYLDEVYFGNRINGGDFRINDLKDGVEYIQSVTLMWLPPGL